MHIKQSCKCCSGVPGSQLYVCMCLPVGAPAEDIDVSCLSLFLKLKYNYSIFPFSFLPPPLPMCNLALKIHNLGPLFLKLF